MKFPFFFFASVFVAVDVFFCLFVCLFFFCGRPLILPLLSHELLVLLTGGCIDGFHCDVIKLLSRNSEVLRILIYTRLKIKSKSLYKFPFP